MIDVRGGPLAVDDSRGSGNALFWGHGFTSCRAHDSAAGMLPFSRLADAGWRVVRWDARGHGESTGPRDEGAYHWDELGRDVVALADALGIDRFVAGGASMGAATALHVAIAVPERVSALVLACPPTAWETRAAQADLYRGGAHLLEEGGVDAYMAVARQRPVPPIFEPIAELFHPEPSIAPELAPTVFRGAASSDLPDAAAIATIAVPTLILAWDTDPGHPLATATRLHELLPQSELVVAEKLADLARWAGRAEQFLEGQPKPD